MTSALRDDVRAWIAAREGELLDALAAAIAVRSLPGTIEQNAVHPIVAAAAGAPTGTGAVAAWVPDWERVAALVAPTGTRPWIDLPGLSPAYRDLLPELAVQVVTHRAGDGPALVLNGHVDVVPAAADGWTAPPFAAAVRDGWLRGRGAMDMKGGLLAAAFAVRYLAERELVRGTLQLASVPEEETGGNGTIALLERGIVGDGVVFTEPTDLRVVHRHVGIGRFLVELHGRGGGILKRSWGTSVTPALGRVLTRLAALEEERQAGALAAGGYDADDLPGFLNVGLVSAGEWVATRAPSALLDGLLSILPGESEADAEAALATAVNGLDLGEVTASVRVLPGSHRGAELDRDAPLVRAFATPGAADDAPGGRTRAGTMVCDAKIVSGGGWAPSIVLGPVGEGLHRQDEGVEIASLLACVEALVLGAARFFGTDPG